MGYPNSGSLFKNDKKKNDKHPDLTGTAEIGGNKFYVSAWVKEGKNSGKKFYSLSFTSAEDSLKREPVKQEDNPVKQDEKTDDLPF